MSANFKAGLKLDLDSKAAQVGVVEAGKSLHSLEQQVERMTGAMRRVGHYGVCILALRERNRRLDAGLQWRRRAPLAGRARSETPIPPR